MCLICLSFLSCRQQDVDKLAVSDRQAIIEYLKNDFKISPNTNEFDSVYLTERKNEHKSLEIDSLINEHLSIVRYEPLSLDFAEYYPQYHYKNRGNVDHFSIYLIRNFKTGKIYFDFINWYAGYMFEDFCEYSGIDMSQIKGISKKDFIVYSSIKSNRKFAGWEIYPAEKSYGIEAFLNEAFRFKKISNNELDSLLSFYDNFLHPNFSKDSLIRNPSDLAQYLSIQSKEIKGRYHTNDDLAYLKDQINLLTARNLKCDSANNFQWIYKSRHRLRERMVSIKGIERTFFSYSIEEKDFCF